VIIAGEPARGTSAMNLLVCSHRRLLLTRRAATSPGSANKRAQLRGEGGLLMSWGFRVAISVIVR
jgi:hypothetical protein